MSRFIGALFPLLLAVVFSAPVGAGSKCTGNTTHPQCRSKNTQTAASQPQQHQAWDEVAAYAKNSEVRGNLSHRDACSADEYFLLIKNEGQSNLCKQYKDKNESSWVIVFDLVYHRTIKLIRLNDMAKVEFNTFERVVSDTTGTKQTRQAKQENPESTKSAQEQVPQVEPADIARKALGSFLKGF